MGGKKDAKGKKDKGKKEPEPAKSGGISWGFQFEIEEVSTGAAPAATGKSGAIDWGAMSMDCIEVVELDERPQGVLDDPAGRELLFEEVAEATAFLEARKDEDPPAGQKYDVGALLKATRRLENLLVGDEAQKLMLLTNPTFLEERVQAVAVSKENCEKPVRRAADVQR